MLRNKSLPKKRLFSLMALVYAILFSFGLFLILPFSQMLTKKIQKKVEIRPIDIVARPPAPPPGAKKANQTLTVEKAIQIQTTDLNIKIEPLDISLDTRLSDAINVKLDQNNFKIAGSGAGQLEILKATNLLEDIKDFSLAELDEMPRSLNNPLIRLPDALEDKEILAQVRIILTEKGTVIFKKIESINYEAAAKYVEEYVQKLKYTPPTRNGVAGRTEFILPVRARVQ